MLGRKNCRRRTPADFGKIVGRPRFNTLSWVRSFGKDDDATGSITDGRRQFFCRAADGDGEEEGCCRVSFFFSRSHVGSR